MESSAEEPRLTQRTMIGPANDHVIQNLDFKDLTRAVEVARHLDVCFRGLWLAARMVVHQHNRCGSDDHGAAEH